MELDALVAEPAWEMFFDTAYFDMWCVRRVGETNFGAGFHVPSKAEAQALIDALEAERSTRVRLEEALRAADYLIDRYRSVHSGQRVRDLDEAEVSYSCARYALSHSSSKGESRE